MDGISRRKFLFISATSPLVFQLNALASQGSKSNEPDLNYPRTISVLQEAFKVEMIAHKIYVGYTSKALSEEYPNIAYLFHSFSYSENIHSDNYKRILAKLGHEAESIQTEIQVYDTKSNLQEAAQNEMRKIESTYPVFIKELETEACEEAIINCMYSWKSHQQHEQKVKEIANLSGIFFGALSSHIEGLKLDFYVCRVCGSTIDKAPHFPCVICNRSMSHYHKIEMPV